MRWWRRASARPGATPPPGSSARASRRTASLFDRVNATVNEIRKLRLEAQDIAHQMTRDAAEQELPASAETTNTEGETKDPEEPGDLDDLNRLDEPPTA